MSVKVWIYQCTNHSSQCNSIERKTGPKKPQIKCSNCGRMMVLIGDETIEK